MAAPIHVLVVDDAVVVRRLVARIIEEHPAFAPPQTASNGRVALQKIAQTVPDAVVLDVEMPEMDGLETLEQIRRHHPRLPVVMFSTLTEAGASATLQALARGATDYVTKPSNTGSFDKSMERVREELVPKLVALTGGRHAVPALGERPAPVAAPRAPRASVSTEVGIVAIGASTGGPNALATVLEELGTVPVPVVVTQHIPPVFSSMLAQRLDKLSPMVVREAADGDELVPGSVWIAPGDRHLLLRRGRSGAVEVALGDGPPENSCRPSVDTMFRSVGDVYGGNVLSVILTGMGSDGLRGTEGLHGLGAQVVAQDQATSVVWGMPGAVVGAGLADTVVPLEGVAAEIRRRLPQSTRPPVPATAH